MAFIKGPLTGERAMVQHGIDFSTVEADKFSTAGETIKFYGGTTMGYEHATRGGIQITSTRAAETAHSLYIEDSITHTAESRKGSLNMYSARSASYPCTSGWGGGEDQLINLTLRNYAANTGGMGMRGFDLNVRQKDPGTATNMYGMLVTIETDSGTTTSGAAYAGRFVSKFNGVHTGEGEQWALEAVDESQTADIPSVSGILHVLKHSNSYSSAHAYGIKIDNDSTNAITHGIYYEGTITYALSFAEADGSQGFTAVTNGSVNGNVDGYISVRDVTTGATLYIPCYDAVPS